MEVLHSTVSRTWIAFFSYHSPLGCSPCINVVLLFIDWVVQLGPATYNGTLYQYSVVTDPEQLQLLVLARNVTGFFIDYAEKVRLHLQYQGFTKYYNKPIPTYQGSDCKYIL